MGKIGKLEFRTVGTGPNRAKVVLFPGHEFSIEHFYPHNLTVLRTLPPLRRPESVRVEEVESKVINQKGPGSLTFIKRRERKNDLGASVDVLTEARIARIINALKIEKVSAEEPLAAILHPNGNHEVIFRTINNTKITGSHSEAKANLRKAMHQIGINMADEQAAHGEEGNITVYDLEGWWAEGNAAKKYKIRPPLEKRKKRISITRI